MKSLLLTITSSILVLLNNGCGGSKTFMTRFNGDRTDLFIGGRQLDFACFLEQEIDQFPDMECADLYEFCRQAAYGTCIIDSASIAVKNKKTASLFRITSPDTLRINIAAWRAAGLPEAWLQKISAPQNKFPDAGAKMAEFLKIAEKFISAGKVKFTLQDFHKYSAEVKTAVHKHSDRYLQKHGAYKLASIRYIHAFPVLIKAAALPPGKRIISIDGRSASGKTTLARQLKFIMEADIVHMDHFFLPPDLRTSGRYNEPGGNIHYERFKKEVIEGIKSGKSFTYQIFDCKKMAMEQTVSIRAADKNNWLIIEGAYSMHPEFGNYSDLKIFYDISQDEQIRRIINRNGQKAAEIFKTRWIPLEEKYINTFRIDQKADLIIR